MKLSSNLHKLLLVVTLCIITINTQAQIIAEIPVSYDVPASGAFQYSVPLRIPPGIKDMVPNLAITYSSQSGDGNMGMGWSLTGLSAITRGVPTIFHDQTIWPVDFSADDALFLDGQRLFWESSTSSYLTEVKNFATIKPFGTAGVGPSYLTVEYPNGTIVEYGNSTGSKMLAQGRSDVLMWVVNKITDIHGNFMTFEYTNNQSSGEYRILQIVYSQNSLTSNDLPVTIDFNYGISRQNTNTAYVFGSQVNNTVLLEDVTIKFSDLSTANKYKFTYDQSGIHPRLTNIEEWRGGTNPLEPININWGTAGGPISNNTNYVRAGLGALSGDFDGDGYTDVATIAIGGSTTQLTVRLNSGSALPTTVIKTLNFVVPMVNNAVTNSETQARQIVDYNGDGMDDIIYIEHFTQNGDPAYRLWLLKANGNPSTVFHDPIDIHTGVNSQSGNSSFYEHLLTTLGDYDGDGKTEVIIFEPYNFINSSEVQDYEVFVVGDEYSSHQIHHYNGDHISNLMTIDFNGDGRDEWCFTEINKVLGSTICYLNVEYNATTLKPSLIQTSTQWPMGFHGPSFYPEDGSKTWTGDFNGDGKSDLIMLSGILWSVSYSNGLPMTTYLPSQVVTGTSHPMAALDNGPPFSTLGAYGCYPADFNGDGLCDFLELKKTSTSPVTYQYNMFYSTGNSFVLSSGSLVIDAYTELNVVGDFNGDGQMDLNYMGGLLTFFDNDNTTKVTSIEHAGKTVNVTYETIPRDANYTQIIPTNNHFIGRTLPVKVVKRMYDGVDMDNTYTYQGFTLHKYGLGVRGFKKFSVENIAQQKTYQTFELETTIPYLKEQQVFDGIGALLYGSLTTFQQFDFPGGAGDKSHIIINSPLKVTDNTSGAATITTITTGSTSPGTVFYDFGKVESTSNRTKDLVGGLNSLQTTTYNYGTNWATLKGKPESVTVYSDIDPTGANSITRTTEYAYYSNGDLQTVKTDPGTPNETVTDYQYDYQNTGDPYGHVVQTDLNANGVPGTITNEYAYTSDGRFLASEINTMGYTTTYNYGNLVPSWGNVVSTTNYKGLETQYTYDAVNRVRIEKDVISSIETNTDYEWAASSGYGSSLPGAHLVVSTSNSYDATAGAKVLDIYGRTLREVSLGGIYVDYTYDDNGQVETVRGPYDSFAPTNPTTTTTYTYDDWGRETERSTDNSGPVIQTSYGVDLGTGLLHTTVTNQGANTWKKSITCGSTLRSVISSGTPNHTIDYTYYGNGTVATTIVNANAPGSSGGAKTFSQDVDAYGRVEKIMQPGVGDIFYTYDALGRVATHTTATGTVYQYEYDPLGRVWKKHMSGAGQPYVYTYDNTNGTGSTGELEQETSPNGHVKDYTYHPEGWLHSVKEDNIFETIYMYYLNGDLKHYTFDNDLTIEYTYYQNQAGVVKDASIISGSHFPLPYGFQKLWWGWWLNPHGQRYGAYFFNTGNSQAYADMRTYDVHGLLERHEMLNNSLGVNIADNHYSFDIHTGNLNWRSDAMPLRNHTEYFTYDNHYDRLSTVSQSLWGGPTGPPILNMGYNEHGNITQKDDAAPPQGSPYDKWRYNHYALETVQLPSVNPFQASVSIPQYRQDIVYTKFEKVQSMREDQNNEVVFTYGADNQRVQATYTDLTGGAVGSLTKTKTYYNNYERIDYPSGAKDELFYVWAGDELVSILKIFSQPGQATISNIYYPMRDHLGSITHLMDINTMAGAASNGIVEERSFDAWGRTRDPNNWQPYPIGAHPATWITDRGYTGHEHIWQPTFANFYDNNIINMDGRLYDPLVGRMFSPDPYIPDGTNTQDYNKYTYARNNPLKYNDPDGNWVNFAIGAVVGGFSGYQIGKANGATGGEMWKYIGIGAGIGLVSGGAASGVSALGGGAFMAGAVGGSVSGAGFSGLANNWNGDAMLNGAWKGAVSGGIGGLAGAAIGGGAGAFAAGAVGGGVNTALYQGNIGEIGISAVLGGVSSYGMYNASSYINWKFRGGGQIGPLEINFKQYMKMQGSYQRARFWHKEFGGAFMNDGSFHKFSKDEVKAYQVDGIIPPGAKGVVHSHWDAPNQSIIVDSDGNLVKNGYTGVAFDKTTERYHAKRDLVLNIHSIVLNRYDASFSSGNGIFGPISLPINRFFYSFNFFR